MPAMINQKDRQILRACALHVREIAALPIQQERIGMWKKHNALRGDRPMLLVFPEGAWGELLPQEMLQCEGEEAKGIERNLRSRIYYHEHLNDDNPILANFDVYKSIQNSGWGVDSRRKQSTEARGSWKIDPVISEPADLKKLRVPTITHDAKDSLARLERMQELFGDILKVRLHGITHISYHLMAQWTQWRGLEQMMMT